MKVGDLVRMPKCCEPDELGIVLEPPKRSSNRRIGILWQGEAAVDFEPIDMLEVVSEAK